MKALKKGRRFKLDWNDLEKPFIGNVRGARYRILGVESRVAIARKLVHY